MELDTVQRSFAGGSVIFQERERADCAYVIERGAVELSTTVGGEPRVLATLGPGEMFGEMAALDGTERSATARAIADTEVTLILTEQLRSRVETADPVLRLLLHVILNRFRHEQSLFRRPGAPGGATLAAQTHASKQAIDKMKLESLLRSALQRNELEIHYQPIVSLETTEIKGFEALLRWQHPELGTISPSKFIGVAEETALIVPIGLWVLERACRDLLMLREAHGEALQMSVNVSVRQFSEPSFITELTRVIEGVDFPADQLKLEITERVLMDHRSGPLRWLEQCKRLGVRMALDDFGTGFSSLSCLASVPLDTLKIDRSFVIDMHRDARSLKVVHAINRLAHTLDMDVVAEGVEETAQHEELARMSCDYGQGFLFSKAVPIDRALELS